MALNRGVEHQEQGGAASKRCVFHWGVIEKTKLQTLERTYSLEKTPRKHAGQKGPPESSTTTPTSKVPKEVRSFCKRSVSSD